MFYCIFQQIFGELKRLSLKKIKNKTLTPNFWTVIELN